MDGQHGRRKRNISDSPWDGADLDGLVAADLYHLPVLRAPSSQYSLDPSRRSHPSHGRSISHPFPSTLSGNGMKRSTGNNEEEIVRPTGWSRAESGKITNQRGTDTGILNKTPIKNGNEVMKDEDLRTGNCLTCDAMVRWPKKLDVYRCTNCLMINDLKSVGKDMMYGTTVDGARQKGRTNRKVCPVTIERTRDLIQQCVTTYLQEKANEIRATSKTTQQKPSPVLVRGYRHELSTFKQENSSLVPQYLQDQETNPKSFPPTRSIMMPIRQADQNGTLRSTSDEVGRPVWKQVFAPLEDYLMSCMQDCDTINASFSLTRSMPLRASSEVSNTSEKYRRREDPSFQEETLFELDAKTLLLGDIGENGQWWTGERQAKSTKSRKEEDSERKPSRFDWASIYAWYDIILSCGKDWKSSASTASSELMNLMVAYESDIDIVFSQGRYHVQRTLLKGFETLLRRPGRPLQTSDDVRFLVILLANPLLYPRSSDPNPTKIVPLSQVDGSSRRKTSSDRPIKCQGIANGHHSGIIKRILGIIANLPILCHQALISWFCRVSEAQFRDLVELVGGFVSYRLTRQKGRSKSQVIDVTAGLIPDLTSPGGGSSARLHAAIGETAKAQKDRKSDKEQAYRDDWQIKTAAKVMSLLFSANMFPRASRYEPRVPSLQMVSTSTRQRTKKHSQLLPTNFFYNTRLDYVDLVGDFEGWEAKRGKFSFCQYPMFLSIWAKIHILEHDARRQMEIKARDAFFTTIMKGKAVSQYLVFKVRRDCLADDSLKNISQIIGGGEEEIKKSLRIEFTGEEGVDAGGLRKEWFLLLIREVFDPEHGLFIYDPDSNYCYFNPFTFETSDQFFLIGVLLGLAIYNSTILDVSLPPFAFRKLLASAPNYTDLNSAAIRSPISYTIADLAEWRPSLARGLQQLLDHEGDDVEEVYCRDFVLEIERYGRTIEVPLCPGGEKKTVTNLNRKEFVDLYIRYLLDTSVARQYEPFKRGFFTVCGGNALSLFRPEEIELLIRGSDEPLDTASLRGVSTYENCSPKEDFVRWFWEILASAEPKYQREILAFITGSDRIPAMGATSLVIKIICLGGDTSRFPVARTCFNVLGLWPYSRKEVLANKLWRAVQESEGFGLK